MYFILLFLNFKKFIFIIIKNIYYQIAIYYIDYPKFIYFIL